MTKDEIAGITRANEGMQGISWSILGQTYVPKTRTEHSFSWHATFRSRQVDSSQRNLTNKPTLPAAASKRPRFGHR